MRCRWTQNRACTYPTSVERPTDTRPPLGRHSVNELLLLDVAAFMFRLRALFSVPSVVSKPWTNVSFAVGCHV